MTKQTHAFPAGFKWGVSTASYQIEGGSAPGERGESVWDMFCRKPGAVYEGHNGHIACDHYHRWQEDIALMRDLGVGGYRFSLSWPRILPSGTCDVNRKGLDFYDQLVDGLLEANIEPWVTLFHWDLPLDLYRRGGWLNPDIVNWFADYTRIVVDRLSDRVQHWMTLNEPQCFIGLGMWEGIHAPGDKLQWREILLAIHHSLLAHGRSVQVIRSHARRTPTVGMAPACQVYLPASASETDIEAARQATFAVPGRSSWNLAWWLDPIFFGKYPSDGVAVYGGEMPEIAADDFKVISEPLDFFGMNLYFGRHVRRAESGCAVETGRPPGAAVTALKWPVTPECLYWGPKFYFERYGKPIVITENGLSNQDWEAVDGRVHDPQRIDFVHRHLIHLRRAIGDGVPVDGYFHWSLLDNFEWAEGYRERFGLVYVDYSDQRRIPKDSFRCYRDVIAAHGSNL